MKTMLPLKLKYWLLAVMITGTVLTRCKKDEEVELPPAAQMSVTGDVVAGSVDKAISFSVSTTNGKGFNHEWKLNGEVKSTTAVYEFTATQSGTYTLVYTATNAAGTYQHTYTINVAVPTVPVLPGSSKFISKVYDYLPAPGQFINESLGSLAGAQKIIGDVNATGLVSLGGYGGYVVFGFDHSVVNGEGKDLAIYGNPILGASAWSEPGIVMVSQDTNGNGKPDDVWYELAGSAYTDPATIKNYEITYTNPKATANVTWSDNQGKTGAVEVNRFHNHNYYPLFAENQEKITFKGTLLKSTWGQVGSVFVNNPFEWGYTDSGSIGDDYATNRYNGFDISWAVDHTGKSVTLKTVDFIKVYTGQNEKGNTLLGEISTEVKGARDLGIQ